jgi:dTMP kinase
VDRGRHSRWRDEPDHPRLSSGVRSSATTPSDRSARRGLLIVLEGGEGVGKTTQWGRLTAVLQSMSGDVVPLREPGGTPAGDVLRGVLLDPASDLTAESEALLFAASRAQLVRAVITPALERDAVVLVDRFLLSTYAYQGAGRQLPLEPLRQANRLATGGLVPDATLLLTMPLDQAMARMEARGETDRLERAGLEFHRRVQEAFEAAASPEWQQRHPEVGPVYPILASGSPEAVTARCVEQLFTCFPTRFAGAMHG